MEGMSENPFAGDVKALQGAKWKDHYRKRVGSYRIIFAIDRDSTLIEILTILIRSEKTYR
jgi:mRNA-degrading endonuclease RelE of RelBE toxin-antitoxin system